MHQTLYRKYRPSTFDSVCGEDHISAVLKHESSSGTTSHAYLFCGPRGTGKTSCAKILAKAVNCENPINGNPCGKCYACTSIDSGMAPDVLEIDAASNNGVDNIRDIRDAVNFTPAALKKRVYIIDEVHMLTPSAFNALLKTLEEPPEHVVFILATTEFHKLPSTIVSRCQRFDFRRIKSDVIKDRLLYIAGEENIPLEENAAVLIAKQAQGGMRDAISLFELCSAGGKGVTEPLVRDILGLAGIEILYKTAVAVARNDTASIFSIVKTVDYSSKDLSVYFQELIGFFRDMLVYRNLPPEKAVEYFDYTEAEMRLFHDAARRYSPEKLSYHFNLLNEALKEMARLPETKRLTAELTLIRMADPKLELTTDALLSRIASLEEKLAVIGTNPSQERPITVTAEPEKRETKPEPEAPNENVTEEIPVPVPDKGNDLTPVRDLGEFFDVISNKSNPLAGPLADCDCFTANDGEKVIIRLTSPFFKAMLESEPNKSAVRSALCVAGIANPDSEIIFDTGAKPKEHNKIDELADF